MTHDRMEALALREQERVGMVLGISHSSLALGMPYVGQIARAAPEMYYRHLPPEPTDLENL